MDFHKEVAERIESNGKNSELSEAMSMALLASVKANYSYNFSWLGRPIIQYPQDIVAMQEIIWRVKPDLIIETGIAHGGSLILSASMLSLIDYCDAAKVGESLNPATCRRRVLGIDIDIRPHNRAEIEAHPMAHRIDMIEGSSVATETVAQVRNIAANYERVLVCLDSNHTHEHVLAELEAYAPMTGENSYCCVFDTMIEDLPDGLYPDRPWRVGNNPKTAVWEYMRRLRDEPRKADDGRPLAFEIDTSIQRQLLMTVAPDGYLKRVPSTES